MSFVRPNNHGGKLPGRYFIKVKWCHGSKIRGGNLTIKQLIKLNILDYFYISILYNIDNAYVYGSTTGIAAHCIISCYCGSSNCFWRCV